MTMNPFVYGTLQELKCIDDASPCLLEQTAMCVIDVAQKNDGVSSFPGQDVFVPWVVCMDKNDDAELCHSRVGVQKSDVDDCLSSRNETLVAEYLKRGQDAAIHATPTTLVNGKVVKQQSGVPLAATINDAICNADPSIQACSGHPAAPCFSISTQVSDAWCTTNCLASLPNCPSTFCMCSATTASTAASMQV